MNTEPPVYLSRRELRAWLKHLEERGVDAPDRELIAKLARLAKRQRWALWWMGLAERVLWRMLAVKNWVRRCQGKPPLVPEEWDDNDQ
jgi:hypothetical protein